MTTTASSWSPNQSPPSSTSVSVNTHEQSIIDWELVALQRHLWNRSDEEMRAALRQRFFDELCSADNDVAFYVGNQAKRLQTFSILGVNYPKEGS